MKKIIVLLTAILMIGYACQAQVGKPATYKYIKKVFGEPNYKQITSYFIFNSANSVTWCIESSDGYIFPIAFGSCNLSKHSMVFQRSISSFMGFHQKSSIQFSIFQKNGGLVISSKDNPGSLLDDSGTTQLRKCDYVLTPSNKLVGSGWKFEDRNTKEKLVLYFKSKTEVLLDGEPRGYIMIGNTVGILSGDNPAKEALVGKFYGQKLNLHRSGYRTKSDDYPWFEMSKTN